MPIGESADLKPNPTSPQSDVWLLALLSETWPTTRPWTLPAFRLCLQIPSPQCSWHSVPPVSLPLPHLHLNHTHHSAMWLLPCTAPASSTRSRTLCLFPRPLRVPMSSTCIRIFCPLPVVLDTSVVGSTLPLPSAPLLALMLPLFAAASL